MPFLSLISKHESYTILFYLTLPLHFRTLTFSYVYSLKHPNR